jgi:hypothetical protein
VKRTTSQRLLRFSNSKCSLSISTFW